jgi:hypothetical protein
MKKSKAAVSTPADVKPDAENDYEADSALETMMRAHEHKMNPEMMARVKKKAGRKLKALAGLNLHDDMEEEMGKPVKSMEELKKIRAKKLARPY